MLTLGISGGTIRAGGVTYPTGFHDSSACLVRDGQSIAAVEQERLDRRKHSSSFPAEAIYSCLDQTGHHISEVDAVGWYLNESTLDALVNIVHTRKTERRIRSRELIMEQFRAEFGWTIPQDRLIYVSHHEAHATATFANSGMNEAIVVVLDGRGEDESGTIYIGRGNDLTRIHRFPISDSIGWLYLCCTELLGYGYGEEYKVMGLAPYGDPSTYNTSFNKLYSLMDRGEYKLVDPSPNAFTATTGSELAKYIRKDFIPKAQILENLWEAGFRPRKKGEAFTQDHMDLAAALQQTIEKIVIHILDHWRLTTGISNLCFSGGVAHNSSLNGAILRSNIFSDVFIHPASHDGGTAEGAALLAAHRLGETNRRTTKLTCASYGPDLGNERTITNQLNKWRNVISYECPHNALERAAKLLSEGAVIGWAFGKSEFGPRALGQRSILADARPEENKDRINKMVKKRESYRPFAPVVTVESADRYFELPNTRANYDFMSYVIPVLPERRSELGAVTHVDGSARVQFVTRETNPRLHQLLELFGRITGTPVLLNTSFNNNAEPIVQTVDDVITCFLTTTLDYVFVENNLVSRNSQDNSAAYGDLVVRLAPGTQIVKHTRTNRSHGLTSKYYIEFAPRPVDEHIERRPISTALFHFLEGAGDGQTINRFSKKTGELTDEDWKLIWSLWESRAISLRPE